MAILASSSFALPEPLSADCVERARAARELDGL